MHEHFFQCPYCWEEISILVDLSVAEQQYVEDCEVCCNPIQFKIQTEDQQLVSFSAENLEQ